MCVWTEREREREQKNKVNGAKYKQLVNLCKDYTEVLYYFATSVTMK